MIEPDFSRAAYRWEKIWQDFLTENDGKLRVYRAVNDGLLAENAALRAELAILKPTTAEAEESKP